jgi:hypothetical protein
MITIGNLAKELKTSNQKLGRLIKHYDLEFEIQYKKGSQRRVLTVETAEKIKELLPKFEMPVFSRIKSQKEGTKPKTKKGRHKECSDEQFVNPIVGRYWGSGKEERWGQGIRTYWEKERCEVC